ncbi:MAG: hypothetical protein MI863_17770, partial [Desulfobacterales bacterium]|nr:hypothetical protein [Desulfobacterales bacterium]
MASIFVLFIEDDLVGKCLELIRKVCEPVSRSKPHVTVRGPIRNLNRKTANWRNDEIKQIQLTEPGVFFSKENSS